jgi:hypothetical protein
VHLSGSVQQSRPARGLTLLSSGLAKAGRVTPHLYFLFRAACLCESVLSDVRPRQRFLVFIQSISACVAEFKWCSFWVSVRILWLGWWMRSPFIKLPKISGLTVQYFQFKLPHSSCLILIAADGRNTRAVFLTLPATTKFDDVILPYVTRRFLAWISAE